jgi:hypothetical protein
MSHPAAWMVAEGQNTAWLPDSIPTTNVVAYWRPGLTGSTNDTTSTWPATLVNGALAVSNIGFSVSTSPAQRVSLGDVDLVSDSTVSFWIYPTLTNGDHQIMHKYGSLTNRPIYIYQSGTLLISFMPQSSLGLVVTNGIIPKRWRHIVRTHTAATSNESLYIDGVLAASRSDISIPAQNDSPLSFGARTDGTFANTFYVDEVVVLSIAASPAEIGEYFTNSYNAEFSTR